MSRVHALRPPTADRGARRRDLPRARIHHSHRARLVAYALVGKGIRLVTLGRVDEGLEHFDDVVATFGKDADDAARLPVPLALAHRGRREPGTSGSPQSPATVRAAPIRRRLG